MPKIETPGASPAHPTWEQAEIRDGDYSRPGLTVVNAYAGTGKTSTLRMICEANPVKRFLYICYNKALQLEAKEKFPRNVECRTTHSLAYGNMFARFGEKMRKFELRPEEISRKLKIGRRVGVAVRDALRSFLQRPGDQFALTDIPERMLKSVSVDEVLGQAARLWKMACDPGDDAPMPHDGYLKLWVATHPRVWQDAILGDEAQDISPVVEAFMLEQAEQKPAVLCGDKFQAIYSWRGAVNAMERATRQATALRKLTKAFRLRQEAAELATLITAFGGDDTDIEAGNEGPFGARGGPPCVLARTNAGLLAEAFDILADGGEPHFIGTKPEQSYDPSALYDFEEILDIDRLRRGEPARTPYIMLFESFSQLAESADPQQGAGDRDLALAFTLVKEHGDKLRGMVDEMRHSAVSEGDATVCLSTVHKAKGLEWDKVRMLDDFPSLDDVSVMREGGIPGKPGVKARKKQNWREELNILYVGATRARDELIAPPNLFAGPRGAAIKQEDVDAHTSIDSLARRLDARRPDGHGDADTEEEF